MSNSEIFLDEREAEAQQDHNFYEEQEEAYKEHQFLKTVNEVNPSLATSEQLASYMIENILEGNIDPLQFAVKKKCIEDALEQVMKNAGVKNLMIEEIEKHGKQGATALGASLTLKNLPKYDYSKDPTWNSLKTEMKPYEDKLKAQEEKIKIACKTNCNLVSDEGEIIASVVPAPSTTSIAVSFKKKALAKFNNGWI